MGTLTTWLYLIPENRRIRPVKINSESFVIKKCAILFYSIP